VRLLGQRAEGAAELRVVMREVCQHPKLNPKPYP
jgi:hypothetical protein